MLIKVMILFLLGMAILAMFGRLRFPGQGKSVAKCPTCGKHKIGRSSCTCKGKA